MILPETVEAVLAIGVARAPQEACGVLLAPVFGLQTVVEVENTADEPLANVFMTPEALQAAVLTLVGNFRSYTGNLTKDLVVWHTHPGGLIGPSREDMRYRKTFPTERCLVVTVPTGEAVQF